MAQLKDAKKLLSHGFIPISFHLNKKHPNVNWTDITKKNCLSKFKIGSNIGIITGTISNVIVIDVDIKDNGLISWKSMISIHGEPKTIKVKSGSGGYHYYFKYSDKIKELKTISKAFCFEGEKIG